MDFNVYDMFMDEVDPDNMNDMGDTMYQMMLDDLDHLDDDHPDESDE